MKNNNSTLYILIIVFQFILLCSATAVKAYPYPVEITQPDGSKLLVQLVGDESRHYKTTEDGYLIKKNKKGFYAYATRNTKGEIIPSSYIAKNVINRKSSERTFLKTINTAKQLQVADSSASVPAKVKQQSVPSRVSGVTPFLGNKKALVIMVNFSDTQFTIADSQTAFSNLLNEVGYSKNGGTGSARDYFMASSYGKFIPEYDVVGPYTLSHDMAYYGQNDIADYDSLPVNMVVEACALANTNGLDFTKYDVNNDGKIDNVFIYYAGYNEAESATENTIWPHRWSIYPTSLYAAKYANFDDSNTSVYFDGKRLFDYACTSELRGKTGAEMCGIGTFVHEFGHVLGLPDYYNTDNPNVNTLEMWSVMDLGAYANNGRTPPLYSAYDRFYLGYFTPQQVSTPSNLTLYPLSQAVTTPANTNNQAYLMSETTHNLLGSTPNPTEFFMIEYRKKNGWDAFLPDEGMLIWHIDYNKTAWDNNSPNNYTGSIQSFVSHMRVYLQPLTNYSSTPGTAFKTGTFTPIKWDGKEINRGIYNIETLSDRMTFSIMPASLNVAAGLSSFATEVGTPSDLQSISVTATNLSQNLNISLETKTDYEIKTLSGSNWSKSLSIAAIPGTLNEIINIRYNPLSAGSQTDKLTLSSVGVSTVTLNLDGNSTAPVTAIQPQILASYIESTLLFAPIYTNTNFTKTLNIKTTDLTGDLTLTLTGTDVSLFNISTNTISKADANAGYQINITYRPVNVGLHTATLTIAGGGLSPVKVINLNASAK